jgi:hypothetical protein
MTNPTNPFSWQMPTASDLVTDLPADFETFGQAVATSMADLLGGTTGQVLSKASNTNMDFTWVTSDDANAIQNAIVDAKGDLIAASAADTPARLAVGTNDQLLVADSTAATGLKWAGEWQTWSPTYSNLTIGNGTVTARYRKVGKRVDVFFKLIWGSTTSTATYPIVSYPIAPVYSSYVAGNATMQDVTAAIYLGVVWLDGLTGMLFMSQAANGTYLVDGTVGSTFPATWTTGDVWTIQASYEVA